MRRRFPILALLLPGAAATLPLFTDRTDAAAAQAPQEVVRIHTSLPPVSHADVVRSSTMALHGRVRSVTHFEHRPGWICRRVVLDVEDCWRGATSGTEEIVLIGGRLGDRITIDDSAPDVRVGEDWVFYLQDLAGKRERLLTAGAQAAAVIRGEGSQRSVELAGRETRLFDLQNQDMAIAAKDAEQKGEQR